MESFISSHYTSLLSIFGGIFSSEQLFAIMNSIVELKKREIEKELNQQKLYISQIELSRKVIEKEMAVVIHNFMYMRFSFYEF